ncbi:MAG: HIT family protein [Nitrospirae bacterium]|nr:HIT family protein [Nitrospirota bacterium]
MSVCPFCAIPAEDVLGENEHALAVHDRRPVSEGHTLIITKRHVDDYFKLSIEEKNETLSLLERMKGLIDMELNPDGYNIGMNIGEAAGQRIFHVHIHLIPRMKGETVNGERAVKGVIRHKMSY